MVSALSILFKAAAFVLWRVSTTWSVTLFMLSVTGDAWVFQRQAGKDRQAWIGAAGHATRLNLAALVAGLAAREAGLRLAMAWKEGVPVVAHFSAWLLRATGLQAHASAGFVHMTTMAGPLRFAASWDALGLDLMLLVLVLAAVTILYRAGQWGVALRALTRVSATLFGVVLARFALYILLFDAITAFVSHETEALPVTLFVRPLAVAALFLPFFPFLLRGLAVAERPAVSMPGAVPFARPCAGTVARLAVAWAIFALLVLFACWDPQGAPKRGRILIDGYRARWSPADRPYDREWYGADSGYNYAVLRRWFDSFFATEVLDGPIHDTTLADADVLVAYLPDRPYSSDELRRIERFVRNGGGLLLIGDHTNVFGSTSHLNALGERFGLPLRFDVLFDLDRHFFQMYDPPRPAPRLLHGMRFMKLRGAASIRSDVFGTRDFMTVGNAKGLPSIYSVGNFYPPPHDDPRMTTGRYVVAAASRVGSGRVVAFADSTIFSNFEIFYPGKYEILLNMAGWLNHRDNAWRGSSRRLAALAALLLALGLAWRARRPRAVLAVAVAAGLVFGASWGLTRLAEEATAAFPEPRRSLRGVFFIADAADQTYILRDFTSEAPYEQRYDVFIQWALRTGVFSGFRLVPDGRGNELYELLRDHELADTALALIVRDEAQLPYLEVIARDSGSRRVMLLFSKSLAQESILRALRQAGLADGAGSAAAIAAAWPAGEALIEVGDRRLLLVFDAERFSDRFMGITEKAVPDAALRTRFDRVFSLYDRLFADAPEGRKGGDGE